MGTTARVAESPTRPAAFREELAGSRYFVTAMALAAAGVLIALQVLGSPALGVSSSTVSDLVFAPGGMVLFPAAGFLMVAAWAPLLARFVTRRQKASAFFTVVAMISLLAAAVFPTDPPGMAALSASAQIHRWSAAVLFVAVPLVGWSTVGQCSGALRRQILRWSTGCAALVVVSMTIQLPKVATGTVAEFLEPALALCGLVERVMLAAMLVLIVRLGRLAATPPQSSTSASRPDRPVPAPTAASRAVPAV